MVADLERGQLGLSFDAIPVLFSWYLWFNYYSQEITSNYIVFASQVNIKSISDAAETLIYPAICSIMVTLLVLQYLVK